MALFSLWALKGNHRMKYQKHKFTFLDSLQPDDFRNAGSFNVADEIIEEIFEASLKKENRDDFICKAATHLFREGSDKVLGLVNLAKIYEK